MQNICYCCVMVDRINYPTGWDRERVLRVLEYYEHQTDEEAIAEDEAAFEDPSKAYVSIPVELVPAVRDLIARHNAEQE